jgi:hypothetical protein
MFNALENMSWSKSGFLLAVLLVAGFLVSWVATDLLRIGRRNYVAVLALLTAAAVTLTVWATGASLSSLVTRHWQAGIVGGIATSVVLAAAMWKLPATLHRSGRDLLDADAWEGLVYGVSEGVLLSGLPVFIAWQAAADAGWSITARWAAGLLASAVMTGIHHFGYWDFRGRKVVPAVIACGALSVAYLATGSMVAPILGHVIMHVVGITKGVELPPHVRTPEPIRA